MCSTPQSAESSGRNPPDDARQSGEAGSAVSEFVMVSALLALVCTAVLQLSFALHVRNTLIDSAGEGARFAALHGSSLSAGVDRTRTLISSALPSTFAENVTARVSHVDGIPVVEIRVTSALPLVGVFGPRTVTSTGRALAE